MTRNRKNFQRKFFRFLLLPIVMRRQVMFLVICAAFLLCAQVASAETPPPPRPTRLPTPLPGGGMAPAWMTPPPLGPTQADAGAVVYYYRCMACHGDQGQGLTVEWRAQWDVEHQDCARSTCHGPRHPPEGFTFPKNFAPAIVGSNTLVKYDNAQALYDFVRARMPYQTPGALSDDEYWQLVAYLIRQRGVDISRVDSSNARAIVLTPPQPLASVYFVAVGAGAPVIAGGVVGWMVWRKKGKPNQR